jgi:hypothetical protein
MGRRIRKNNGGSEFNQGFVSIYGNVTMKPPVQLRYTNKNF